MKDKILQCNTYKSDIGKLFLIRYDKESKRGLLETLEENQTYFISAFRLYIDDKGKLFWKKGLYFEEDEFSLALFDFEYKAYGKVQIIKNLENIITKYL